MGRGPDLLVLVVEEEEAPLAEGGRYSMRRPGRIFSLVMMAWSWDDVFLLVRVRVLTPVQVRVLVDASGLMREGPWIDNDDDNDDDDDGEKASM